MRSRNQQPPLTADETPGPIGVFDSGYGGLTILRSLRTALPEYDYIYLGDNARAPYGSRSFEIVYKFTLQAVKKLFSMGCKLVILGCNTASAKALRSIQTNYLPRLADTRRVLGVIRPTVEALADVSRTGHIGLMATVGTVRSRSYDMEIAKLCPTFRTFSQGCPMLVPLVEYGEWDKKGADYFVKQYVTSLMAQSPQIDTIILGCTHFPVLIKKLRQYVPNNVTILTQGQLVADSLKAYFERKPEIEKLCTRGGTVQYYTTESTDRFNELAGTFLLEPVNARQTTLT